MGTMTVGSAGFQEWGSEIAQAEWNRMSKQEVDQYIKGTETLKGWEKTQREGNIEMGCSYFTSSEEYKSGNTTAPAYRICCEMVDYCSFYKQTWFYLACAGGVVLLIIIIIVIVCCCCRKGRGGGGKDAEAIEETTEE
ncbi:hypothetical protein CAEBREN_04010 [Caenorhabditis brenneri]|uniref:Uncharacterized protein n=1 Tax=Caenorhabditis brenneri TaxID=135651 RepID=G0MDL0_CAEBE|nr:hypothetical protein CAEBREN_04010 [Caenorhabditis brenneri]